MELHYDREVDIAMICIEDGRAISQEHPWGLIERHPDDSHLMGFEIWRASTLLPFELIAAMSGRDSDPSKPHGVTV